MKERKVASHSITASRHLATRPDCWESLQQLLIPKDEAIVSLALARAHIRSRLLHGVACRVRNRRKRARQGFIRVSGGKMAKRFLTNRRTWLCTLALRRVHLYLLLQKLPQLRCVNDRALRADPLQALSQDLTGPTETRTAVSMISKANTARSERVRVCLAGFSQSFMPGTRCSRTTKSRHMQHEGRAQHPAGRCEMGGSWIKNYAGAVLTPDAVHGRPLPPAHGTAP